MAFTEVDRTSLTVAVATEEVVSPISELMGMMMVVMMMTMMMGMVEGV